MESPDMIRQAIRSAAGRHGLDPAIVYGVCRQESDLDPRAVRYEPRYRWIVRCPELKPVNCAVLTEENLQKCSIGIMQVMGAVYREQGYAGWLTAIFCDLEAQLDAGCRHLARAIKRWGSLEDGLAAYNAGSPRRDKAGNLINQDYVDGVLRKAAGWPPPRQ